MEGASVVYRKNTVSFRRKLTGTKYQGGDFVPKAPRRRRFLFKYVKKRSP